jgi:hypothetical protein
MLDGKLYRGPSRVFLSSLMITLLLQGCATFERSDCPTQGWRMRGFTAAITGQEMNRQVIQEADCAFAPGSPAWEAYRSGYADGLKNYCRPGSLFELGRQGDPYPSQCHATAGDLLQISYGYGWDIHELDEQITRLDQRISVKQQALQRARTELAALQNASSGGQAATAEAAERMRQVAQRQARVRSLQRELADLKAALHTRRNQLERLVSVLQ